MTIRPEQESRQAVVDQIRSIVDKTVKPSQNLPDDSDYLRLSKLMLEWELDILRRAGVVVKT